MSFEHVAWWGHRSPSYQAWSTELWLNHKLPRLTPKLPSFSQHFKHHLSPSFVNWTMSTLLYCCFRFDKGRLSNFEGQRMELGFGHAGKDEGLHGRDQSRIQSCWWGQVERGMRKISLLGRGTSEKTGRDTVRSKKQWFYMFFFNDFLWYSWKTIRYFWNGHPFF